MKVNETFDVDVSHYMYPPFKSIFIKHVDSPHIKVREVLRHAPPEGSVGGTTDYTYCYSFEKTGRYKFVFTRKDRQENLTEESTITINVV